MKGMQVTTLKIYCLINLQQLRQRCAVAAISAGQGKFVARVRKYAVLVRNETSTAYTSERPPKAARHEAPSVNSRLVALLKTTLTGAAQRPSPLLWSPQQPIRISLPLMRLRNRVFRGSTTLKALANHQEG